MSNEAYQHSTEVVIESGQTKSRALAFRGAAQDGYIIPAAFTGTAVSFEVSADGITFAPFHDTTNTLVSQSVTVSTAYAFPLNLFPFAWVKIVSNASEGADRTIQIAHKY